jgi:hypothetical protein
MPDSIEIALLPRLMKQLEAEAPKIRIRVRSIDRFDDQGHGTGGGRSPAHRSAAQASRVSSSRGA